LASAPPTAAASPAASLAGALFLVLTAGLAIGGFQGLGDALVFAGFAQVDAIGRLLISHGVGLGLVLATATTTPAAPAPAR
jgi:hypothetical protein